MSDPGAKALSAEDAVLPLSFCSHNIYCASNPTYPKASIHAATAMVLGIFSTYRPNYATTYIVSW